MSRKTKERQIEEIEDDVLEVTPRESVELANEVMRLLQGRDRKIVDGAVPLLAARFISLVGQIKD